MFVNYIELKTSIKPMSKMCIEDDRHYNNRDSKEDRSLANDMDQLRAIVQQLTLRVEQLEKDNRELRQQRTVTNKHEPKMALLSPASHSYMDWINTMFSYIPDQLNTVFENDLIAGIKGVFDASVQNTAILPIAVFDKRPGTFYYYNENGAWTVMEPAEFNTIVNRICYHFVVEFKRHWYDPNLKKIQELNEYRDKYNDYYMKILGGTRISDDSRRQRIRNYVYQLIKQ
jgi:hypothetical protein